MNAELGMVFPSIVLFSVSLVLTAVSLWVGGKLAPWFLKEGFQPPTVRSYFTDFRADADLDRGRVVTALIALAIMLTALLAMAVMVKFGGVELL
jgi:cytochrome bd-type quinol oxidase subunit 1